MEIIGNGVDCGLNQRDGAADQYTATESIANRERNREVNHGEADCFAHLGSPVNLVRWFDKCSIDAQEP